MPPIKDFLRIGVAPLRIDELRDRVMRVVPFGGLCCTPGNEGLVPGSEAQYEDSVARPCREYEQSISYCSNPPSSCDTQPMIAEEPTLNPAKIRAGLIIISMLFLISIVLFGVVTDPLGRAVFAGVALLTLIRVVLLFRGLRRDRSQRSGMA